MELELVEQKPVEPELGTAEPGPLESGAEVAETKLELGPPELELESVDYE